MNPITAGKTWWSWITLFEIDAWRPLPECYVLPSSRDRQFVQGPDRHWAATGKTDWGDNPFPWDPAKYLHMTCRIGLFQSQIPTFFSKDFESARSWCGLPEWRPFPGQTAISRRQSNPHWWNSDISHIQEEISGQRSFSPPHSGRQWCSKEKFSHFHFSSIRVSYCLNWQTDPKRHCLIGKK